MNLCEIYQKNGLDYQTVLRRFCNDEKMLLHFVLAFFNDPVFQQLSQAVQADDYSTMNNHVHTLMGVAGNLGFDHLCAPCTDMVADMWGNNFPDALHSYERVRQAYQRLMADVQALSQETDAPCAGRKY